MTTFATQTYNMMLQSLLFSITPALPPGAAGTRLPVGTPETIPDVTFITRTVTAADGIEPAAERTRLNLYITQAIAYHNLYGLTPILIDSIEDILNHFQNVITAIGRIRIVAHGSASFLFVPMFKGGSWGAGIQTDLLEAFQSSSEEGLRFLISNNRTLSPLLTDSVGVIVEGIRVHNSSVLAPFGLNASGYPPAGDELRYFEVINDLYQVKHGQILAQGFPPPPNPALLSVGQQTTLNNSLNIIEKEIRDRLVSAVRTPALIDAHMTALRDAILAATPAELGFFGPVKNLGATVLTDLATAMGAAPQDEDDLRNAIVGNLNQPMFENLSGNIITGIENFNPTAFTLNGALRDKNFVMADPDLINFLFICNDLFFLKNGRVSINGTPITAPQRATLRGGLLAIANIISNRIVAKPGDNTTAAELSGMRNGIEGLATRQSLTNMTHTLDTRTISDLAVPNTALTVTVSNVGFRIKLNHLRSIMQNTSTIDIRGCQIGAATAYLDTLRDFFGTVPNLPIISAPEWFQSFPSLPVAIGSWSSPITDIFTDIDAIASTGSGADITPANVTSSFNDWKGLIDFDPHFTFISGLFSATTSRIDFASLEWRVWRTGLATTGIPILKMQAERIDDIVGLNLGDILERFRLIFEIAVANSPDVATRGRLNQLQPHIVTFKTVKTAVAAITGGADPALPGLQSQLTTLATQITGIAGFAPPAAPISSASASLADIQDSLTKTEAHIVSLLATSLNAFFTAVQARLAQPIAQAQIRYYYNIGLPLLLRSSASPTIFTLTTFMSAISDAQRTGLVARALRSWMKIQWKGTPAQATTMNARVDAVAIGTGAQRQAAAQVSMLTESADPVANPTSLAAINPMPAFQTHIITRP